MYSDITDSLLGAGTAPGVLGDLTTAVGDNFLAVVPVALPVVAGIAIAFFAIKVVRAILHI